MDDEQLSIGKGGIKVIYDGIVRNLDRLGRVVIPKEIRKKHSMNEGEPVVISDCGSYVVVKKYRNGCIFCGKTKEVIEYRNICICNKCRKALSNNINEVMK